MLINCFNKSSNKSNVRKKNSLASKNEDIKKKNHFIFLTQVGMCHFHFYFSHLENIIFLTNFKIFEDIDWSGVIESRAQAQLLTSLGFEV